MIMETYFSGWANTVKAKTLSGIGSRNRVRSGNRVKAFSLVQAGLLVGMAIQVWVLDTRRVPDLTGTGTILYPRVAPVPDPNRDGYGTGIFPTRG
jgi:hypothetical protein